MKTRQKTIPPSSPETWLDEIQLAYADAKKAIPFGPVVGRNFDKQELFHLAPLVAAKFRGHSSYDRAVKRAREAALSSYVASLESQAETLSDPRLAFAFCYLASHFGLDLVDIDEVESVMEHIEQNIHLWNEAALS